MLPLGSRQQRRYGLLADRDEPLMSTHMSGHWTMLRRRCAPLCFVIVAFAPLCGAIDRVSAAEDAGLSALGTPVTPEAVAAVGEGWKASRSEISTAEIEYLNLGITCQGLPLGERRALEIINEIDWHSDDDAAIVEALVWKLRPDWLLQRDDEMLDLWMSNLAKRKTLLLRGQDHRFISPTHEHVVARDLHLVADHANEHVRAYRHGACPIWHDNLEWWRLIPDRDVPTFSKGFLSPQGTLDLYYHAEPGPQASCISLNPEFGLPVQWRHFDTVHRKLRRIDLLRDYAQFAGEVPFPTLRVEINFQNERVSNLQINLVRSAKFNLDLPDERFALPLSRGWKWFDARQATETVGMLESDTANIAQFFRTQASPPPAPATQDYRPRRWNWRSVLLVVNGVLLLSIGIHLWRRT